MLRSCVLSVRQLLVKLLLLLLTRQLKHGVLTKDSRQFVSRTLHTHMETLPSDDRRHPCPIRQLGAITLSPYSLNFKQSEGSTC